MEVRGEDQVVAVQTHNLTPVQMGNVRQSDVLAGLIQGNLGYDCHLKKMFLMFINPLKSNNLF